MPAALSYPGVYVEEIPSGVRAITGVATSITAFIGRAARGPVNKATTIGSYGDFERIFGGLWTESTMAYAVRDFYLNGGSQAVIIRLFNGSFDTEALRAAAEAAAQAAADDVADAANAAAADAAAAAAAARAAVAGGAGTPERAAAEAVATAAEAAALRNGATPATVGAAATAAKTRAVGSAAGRDAATFDVNGLELEAANPGSWANDLYVRVDHDVDITSPDAPNMFNLTVRDSKSGATEILRNLSVTGSSARRVDRVVNKQSVLVKVAGDPPVVPAARPTAHADPAAGTGVWEDDQTTTYDRVVGFASDGDRLTGAADFTPAGAEGKKQGLYALEQVDLFNLLCIPPHGPETDIETALIDAAIAYCEKRRAMMIVDPAAAWDTAADKVQQVIDDVGGGTRGATSKNAAIYFPRLLQANPLRDGQEEAFAPCGAVAGLFARTDSNRGVWKAPAGLEATLVNAPKLSVPLTDLENGRLNMLGINCMRTMAGAGRVVWGSRTRVGDDRLASEWKYVPVRRTALFIEESLFRGTHWVVFEPNDEPLWASIRLNVGAFMQRLFRQGAFQGASPREAYFVKCDSETTTQADIDLGIVNILVGFAPLKPAEFVVIKLQQMAGNIET